MTGLEVLRLTVLTLAYGLLLGGYALFVLIALCLMAEADRRAAEARSKAKGIQATLRSYRIAADSLKRLRSNDDK